MTARSEREAFEVYMMHRWGLSGRGQTFARDDDGEYINANLEFGWPIWQARAGRAHGAGEVVAWRWDESGKWFYQTERPSFTAQPLYCNVGQPAPKHCDYYERGDCYYRAHARPAPLAGEDK